MSSTTRWSLVIHGGAGIIERSSMTPTQEAAVRAALAHALDAAGGALAAGGGAVAAVEAAVRVLEDDPAFNAGRGAVFTYDGVNELDAAIMDGRTRAAGAVTGVTRTRNPVTLARAIMDYSPHVMLARDGADRFAAEHGIEQVDPAWFATAERRQQLDMMKDRGSDWFDMDLKYGTVGAVAVDDGGHVAAATSTGGLTGKRWGRIGDSPIIGAGTYADDRAGAVSATGAGEFFIREGVAHEICARVRFTGEDIVTAARKVMAEVTALGGSGGVIVAGPGGDCGWAFTTPGMYRARVSGGRAAEIALYGDEG